jgi:hypothetical protein
VLQWYRLGHPIYEINNSYVVKRTTGVGAVVGGVGAVGGTSAGSREEDLTVPAYMYQGDADRNRVYRPRSVAASAEAVL